jgi:SAM-dependent methyltransferase
MDPEIASFYALGLEAERLWAWGRLERVRAQELLARFLPPAPATVLDVGGGPGAYAVWLARHGYAVRLIDPVELHVAEAREAAAAQPDAYFAPTIDGIRNSKLDEPGFEALIEHDLRAGIHRNPDGRPDWFTTAFFHRPEHLAAEVEAAGLALDALVAIEGVGHYAVGADAWLDDPARREALLRAIRRVVAEPALLGASPHVLAVGRAPHRGGRSNLAHE